VKGTTVATRWLENVDIVLTPGRLKWSWRLTSYDSLENNTKVYALDAQDPKTGKRWACRQPITHELLLTVNAQRAITKAVELLADRAERIEREEAKPLELKVAEALMEDC